MALIVPGPLLFCLGVVALLAALVLQRFRKPANLVPIQPGQRRPLSLPKKLGFTGVMFVVFGLVVYEGSVSYRSWQAYTRIKKSRVFRPPAFAFDQELGHVPIPNYRGEMKLPLGPGVPVRHDENGFRVPMEEPQTPISERPVVLALGCSFTYGYACRAEDTFPYLVGGHLKGKAINAGASGQGLAHMSLLARKLIPQYKPDYVLVQYSPWLLARAVHPTPEFMTARQPEPYFYEAPEGKLAIEPPVFRACSYELPWNSYADTEMGFGDYLAFQWQVGLPLYLHDDSNWLLYRLKTSLGMVPRPAVSKDVAARGYREIADLCAEAHAQMVIVVVGFDSAPLELPESLSRLPALVVRADAVLRSRLAEPTDECYAREYGHWRGSPAVQIDAHPNPLAHSIIARAVVEAIEKNGYR